MKPYSEYTAEELAMERLFIRWVRQPDDPHVGKFWVDWVEQHPQQAATVESARVLVDSVSDWGETEIEREDEQSLWARIRSSIARFPARGPLFGSGGGWSARKWSIGFVATVGLVALWFLNRPHELPHPSRSTLVTVPDSTTTLPAKNDSIQASTFSTVK